MRKILDGAVCDTKTAKQIAKSDNGQYINDPKFYCETLFRNKFGKYFLHLHGGPDSPVAEYKGIQRIAGERLIGLTFDEAKTWAQKSLPAKEYDILFGDGTDDESGDTTFKTFCLTRSAKRILDEKVSREGRSSSAIINELLEQLGRD